MRGFNRVLGSVTGGLREIQEDFGIIFGGFRELSVRIKGDT